MIDVTVVIRAAGERTEKLCQYIIEQQVPKEQVFVIHEKPFWKAVQRTFEIGIEQGRKWTLAIDADVLLKKGGIAEMIQCASSFDDDLFVYQGHVYDYIFGKPRSGGPHLYKTSVLTKALNVLEENSERLRPESDTYKRLSKKGFKCVSDAKIFGLHDYGQWRRDLFRKAFMHAHKHSDPKYTGVFIKYWKSLLQKDQSNAKSLLYGWFQGILNDRAPADIDYLIKVVEDWNNAGLNELGMLSDDELNELISLTAELSSYDKSLAKKIIPKPKLSLIDRIRGSLSNRLMRLSMKIMSQY